MTRLLSLPNCQQCRMTERKMNDLGVVYEVVKMDEDEAAAETAKSLGYLSAPVVIAPDGTHWNGYRPDLIESLVS